MIHSRRDHLRLLPGFIGLAVFPRLAEEPDFSDYADAAKENFLKKGVIVAAEEIDHGVTRPVKARISLDGLEHDAQIQVVDKELSDFFPKQGGPIPMKDCWRFNVAAYRLDRLLELNMVAVAVPRPFKGKPAAFSWWVDNVKFEEVEQVKKNLKAPDSEDFERQHALSQVFDELIMNIDRNLRNILITESWDIALIDHTRSFTPYHGIRNEENLKKCSRKLLEGMKRLSVEGVSQEVGEHLTASEVEALLSRRDRIVEFFAEAAEKRGAENVLFP